MDSAYSVDFDHDYVGFYQSNEESTGCLKKKYAKLIRHNLKLITWINNISLFSNFTQSNLNFGASFVGIHQVLREIWLFQHEFQAISSGQLWIFGGIKFGNKLFILNY